MGVRDADQITYPSDLEKYRASREIAALSRAGTPL
jgi:hypothetical protein